MFAALRAEKMYWRFYDELFMLDEKKIPKDGWSWCGSVLDAGN
jgi:hypothetical protein